MNSQNILSNRNKQLILSVDGSEYYDLDIDNNVEIITDFFENFDIILEDSYIEIELDKSNFFDLVISYDDVNVDIKYTKGIYFPDILVSDENDTIDLILDLYKNLDIVVEQNIPSLQLDLSEIFDLIVGGDDKDYEIIIKKIERLFPYILTEDMFIISTEDNYLLIY